MKERADETRKKILFLVGSLNQTTQMHQVASELEEYDCYFSQLYSKHPVIKLALKKGLLEGTVLGKKSKAKADQYLQKHNLSNDYCASVFNNKYDLAVLCSDMLVTNELRKIKTVWVQEGMTDPVTSFGNLIHSLKLPSYLVMNTAFNGCSNVCDIYCAASKGYKNQFAERGTGPSRIFVTGIPNYDNIRSFLNNDFPYRDYVLAATSDIRETFNKDDREAFIKKCVTIADGRPLIFKLHPNEIKERAVAEIKKFAPDDTLIYTDGNTNDMITNCEELITQYSTVVYIGIALGKKVHSYFDVDELKKLAPVQNGGRSAAAIAEICRNYIEFKGGRKAFLKNFVFEAEYA